MYKQSEKSNIMIDDVKRRETTQKELSGYLSSLRSVTSRNEKKDSNTLKNKNENHDEISDEGVIVFPPNFDEIVNCMSRYDIMDDMNEKNANSTNNSNTWPYHIFQKEISQLGMYQSYDNNHFSNNNDDNNNNNNNKKTQTKSNSLIQQQIAKMEEYDKKLAQKEKQQYDNQIRYHDEISHFNEEIEKIIQEKRKQEIENENKNENENESQSSMESIYANEGIQSNPKTKNRFFMTDTLRSNTPTSSINEELSMNSSIGSNNPIINEDCTHNVKKKEIGNPTKVEQKKKRNGIKIYENIQKCSNPKKLLTIKDEQRIAMLLLDESTHDDQKNTMSLNVNHKKNTCDTKVYGGVEMVEKLKEIDMKLQSLGTPYYTKFNDDDVDGKHDDDDNVDDDDGHDHGHGHGHDRCQKDGKHPEQNHFRNVTMERENKKKLHEINLALQALSNQEWNANLSNDERSRYVPLQNLDSKSYKESLYLQELHRVFNEAKEDLEDEGIPLRSSDDIQILIESLA